MNKYLKLGFALVCIYVFVTVVVPAINSLPFFTPMQENIRKWDINTSAFFYTDNISSNPDIRKYTDK